MPPKTEQEKSVGEVSSSAEQAYRLQMVERIEERRILRDLIKANIGLSKDRANALKMVFRKSPANMTQEELQRNDQQRLEGMVEMALVRLNHAKSDLAAKNTKPNIPEKMVEPPEEDGYPASKRRRTSATERGSEQEPNANLYEVYGYPEEEEYTKTFPMVEGE
ncbi:hypothetical protein MMC29_003710 [Sticta canariensis]|nr:hypothetical protein [Sticta canariensis]